jgi:hypothetical protein
MRISGDDRGVQDRGRGRGFRYNGSRGSSRLIWQKYMAITVLCHSDSAIKLQANCDDTVAIADIQKHDSAELMLGVRRQSAECAEYHVGV